MTTDVLPISLQGHDLDRPRDLPDSLRDLHIDLSSTPGGTLFSTTPGGTRITYDRRFLLQCRNTLLSRTPPSNLPPIPGVTVPKKNHLQLSPPKQNLNNNNKNINNNSNNKKDVKLSNGSVSGESLDGISNNIEVAGCDMEDECWDESSNLSKSLKSSLKNFNRNHSNQNAHSANSMNFYNNNYYNNINTNNNYNNNLSKSFGEYTGFTPKNNTKVFNNSKNNYKNNDNQRQSHNKIQLNFENYATRRALEENGQFQMDL